MKQRTLLLMAAGLMAVSPVNKSNAQTVAKSAMRPGYNALPGGLQYKIIKHGTGKNTPNQGDALEFNVKWKVGKYDGKSKDSLLVDSRTLNAGKPLNMPYSEPKFAGDMQAVFPYLHVGDSAVIIVSIDSLKKTMKDQAFPPFAKNGRFFIYEVALVSITDKDKVASDAAINAKKQSDADEVLLKDYFAKNKLNPTKTASGLYYTISKEGSGETITPGKTVSMLYTGKLLDGKVFDSNVDPQFNHTEPFTIQAGAHAVIPGFDEAILLAKKGMKMTAYIPSVLGYGAQSPAPSIPANAVMVFDVEVTEVQ